MITLDTTLSFVWVLGLIGWAVLSIYFARKNRWFSASCSMEAFPFNARQFFVIGASLFFSIAIFLVAGKLAHSLVLGFQNTPLVDGISENYSIHEWTTLERIIGLILMTGGLSLLVSLLPHDLLPIVTGKERSIKKWCKGAFVGFMAFPLIMIVTNVVGWVVSKSHVRIDQEVLVFLKNLDWTTGLFYVLIVCIVFIVPYVEEIIYRGFVQGFLGGLIHPVLAISITAVLFSAIHYAPSQRWSNIEIMAGLFVYSILASCFRLRENSVAAAIGMHTVFNAVSLACFFLLA